MVMLMKDMDSESGSQNGLQGVDVEDPAHKKQRTMVIWARPGTQREAHRIFVPQTSRFYDNSTC